MERREKYEGKNGMMGRKMSITQLFPFPYTLPSAHSVENNIDEKVNHFRDPIRKS